MNRRNSKLLGHVARTLIEGGVDKPLAKGVIARNHAANLKRKLKATWNAKPKATRHVERLGLIRGLVEAHNV